MRHAWIVGVLAAGACGGKSASGTGTAAPTPAAAPSVWDVLTVPGSRWVLHDSMSQEETPPELTITVADVRTVADAKVARLDWSVRYSPDGEPEKASSSLVHDVQWAVSPRGLWMIEDEDGDGNPPDDAAIAKLLAGPPHWPTPPVDTDAPVGRYLSTQERGGATIVCIGEIPDLGGEDCPDICGGGLCLAEQDGIIQVDAQWAPDMDAIYEQDGYETAGPPGSD